MRHRLEPENCYDILGLAPGCTIRDVKRARRQLAHRWHPDRFQNPADRKRADDKFKTINAACDVLIATLRSGGASTRTSSTQAHRSRSSSPDVEDFGPRSQPDPKWDSNDYGPPKSMRVRLKDAFLAVVGARMLVAYLAFVAACCALILCVAERVALSNPTLTVVYKWFNHGRPIFFDRTRPTLSHTIKLGVGADDRVIFRAKVPNILKVITADGTEHFALNDDSDTVEWDRPLKDFRERDKKRVWIHEAVTVVTKAGTHSQESIGASAELPPGVEKYPEGTRGTYKGQPVVRRGGKWVPDWETSGGGEIPEGAHVEKYPEGTRGTIKGQPVVRRGGKWLTSDSAASVGSSVVPEAPVAQGGATGEPDTDPGDLIGDSSPKPPLPAEGTSVGKQVRNKRTGEIWRWSGSDWNRVYPGLGKLDAPGGGADAEIAKQAKAVMDDPNASEKAKKGAAKWLKDHGL